MNPHHGEIWLADMGMAAKTRPAVVLMADNLNAPRSLRLHAQSGTRSPLDHWIRTCGSSRLGRSVVWSMR
jgi:mRNA-degrading endonuclease toxin of MazEF toxin-antitoxin module